MLRFSVVLLAACAVAAPLSAQVGNAPDHSPYHEILSPTSLTATFGHFTKDAGQYGLGPSNGFTYGLRYAFRANKFIELSIAATKADLKRNQVDPFVTVANRVTGPFSESMVIGEAGLTANLTGGKTWHGLAPFVGIAAGAAFSTGYGATVDSSGYKSGTKFVFTPHAGTRIFLTPKLHLRVEAKAVLWKLTYPPAFGAAPPAEPTASPVITNGRFKEWTQNAILQVGLGYAIGIL